MEQNYV